MLCQRIPGTKVRDQPGKPASWTLVRSGGTGPGLLSAMAGLQGFRDGKFTLMVLEESVSANAMAACGPGDCCLTRPPRNEAQDA